MQRTCASRSWNGFTIICIFNNATYMSVALLELLTTHMIFCTVFLSSEYLHVGRNLCWPKLSARGIYPGAGNLVGLDLCLCDAGKYWGEDTATRPRTAIMWMACIINVTTAPLPRGWSVCVCVCVYVHTQIHASCGVLEPRSQEESTNNPGGLHLGIYVFVYVQKVHMYRYMLWNEIKTWATACLLLT